MGLKIVILPVISRDEYLWMKALLLVNNLIF